MKGANARVGTDSENTFDDLYKDASAGHRLTKVNGPNEKREYIALIIDSVF